MYPLEGNILDITKQAQRDLRRGVLPKHVQARLPFYVSEQALRKYMVRLWQRGELMRIGGTDARRGYRTPTLVERVAFHCTGMYPYGAGLVA